MYKVFSLLLAVIVLCGSVAVADSSDISLSSLSYSELEALAEKINQEMKTRPEWKGVKVPAGTWTVGIDIPAGEYSIAVCNEGQKGRMSIWGKAVDDYVSNGGCVYPLVFGYEYSVYGKCVLIDGYIVDSTIDVYFSEPIKLGF